MFAQLLAQSDSSSSALGGGLVLIVYLAIIVVMLVSLWKLFEKMGQPGWYGIIPIFNFCVIAKLAGRWPQQLWLQIDLCRIGKCVLHALFHPLVLRSARGFHRSLSRTSSTHSCGSLYLSRRERNGETGKFIHYE
jgi:chromate transport protein ChrA